MERFLSFDELFSPIEHHYEPTEVLRNYLELNKENETDTKDLFSKYSYFIDISYHGKAVVTRPSWEGMYRLSDFDELREVLPYYTKGREFHLNNEAPLLAFRTDDGITYMLQFVKNISTRFPYA
jgi:hypothetical protein